MWCIPKIDGDFVARMEDVVELYTQPWDPDYPVVCFDESPTQLIGENRVPIPAASGILGRTDHAYRRNGTANLFVFVDAHSSGVKSRSPTAAPTPRPADASQELPQARCRPSRGFHRPGRCVIPLFQPIKISGGRY